MGRARKREERRRGTGRKGGVVVTLSPQSGNGDTSNHRQAKQKKIKNQNHYISPPQQQPRNMIPQSRPSFSRIRGTGQWDASKRLHMTSVAHLPQQHNKSTYSKSETFPPLGQLQQVRLGSISPKVWKLSKFGPNFIPNCLCSEAERINCVMPPLVQAAHCKLISHLHVPVYATRNTQPSDVLYRPQNRWSQYSDALR